jgi:very-short-patch-repair endonuclease
MDAVPKGLVVISVRHPLHLDIEGVTFHQLGDLAPSDLVEIDGFPTTSAARTIVDLAAVLGTVRLRHAAEDSIVRGLMSYDDVAGVLRRVRRRGKPGVRKLVGVLADMAGEPPPESELERLLWLAVARTGLPASRQHPLPTREPVHNVVDVAITTSRLILEADGRRWHARQQAMANDRRRDREAARFGWQTLRFMHEDLRADLDGCVDDILEVHRQRAGLRAS